MHTLEAARAATACSATSTPPPPASIPSTGRPTPTSRRCRRRTPIRPQPQDAYGWEKLITERLCQHYREDYGLETRDRALPQHLRPARHLGRRPREGAGGDLPQGRDGQADRRARDRDLGRRRADALVLLHRRLRRGHLPADAVRITASRSTSAGPHGHASTSWPTSSPMSPASSVTQSSRRRVRRACAAATRTTRGCARCSAGSRGSRSRTGSPAPTPGSRSRCAESLSAQPPS